VNNDEKPIANPHVVLREEFDDWAILFNADTGRGFGLSPTGVYVWKLLDGEHTMDDLLKEVRSFAHQVPEEAREHVGSFIDELTAEGLVGFDSVRSDLSAGMKKPENFPSAHSEHACRLNTLAYAPPELIDLSWNKQAAHGLCNPTGAGDTGCRSGSGEGYNGPCQSGPTASYCYDTGANPFQSNCHSGACTVAECNNGTAARGECNSGATPYGCGGGSGAC
jgi:SynChlorMet cassette protein ScmD